MIRYLFMLNCVFLFRSIIKLVNFKNMSIIMNNMMNMYKKKNFKHFKMAVWLVVACYVLGIYFNSYCNSI